MLVRRFILSPVHLGAIGAALGRPYSTRAFALMGDVTFLHDLTGSGRTLLQATRDRLAPLVGDRVVVVTGGPHRDAVLEQLPEVDPALVVAEPSARDSMAAIGL